MKKSVVYLVQAAMIAALYVVINYAEGTIFPGSTTMAIQFRAAEALCLLACLTPAAIPGLTVGCFIANFITIGVLPLDIFIGTLASLLAALVMYALRDVKTFKLPLVAALMPAVFNGIIVGLELELFLAETGFRFTSFLVTAAFVALGELVVCFVLGLPLYKALERTKALDMTRSAKS